MATHIYLVGKSTSQETNFAYAAAKDSISFAFHFAILCSGHRGHSARRFFRVAQMYIRGSVFFGAAQAWSAIPRCSLPEICAIRLREMVEGRF